MRRCVRANRDIRTLPAEGRRLPEAGPAGGRQPKGPCQRVALPAEGSRRVPESLHMCCATHHEREPLELAKPGCHVRPFHTTWIRRAVRYASLKLRGACVCTWLYAVQPPSTDQSTCLRSLAPVAIFAPEAAARNTPQFAPAVNANVVARESCRWVGR